jgi:hypothetical protein
MPDKYSREYYLNHEKPRLISQGKMTGKGDFGRKKIHTTPKENKESKVKAQKKYRSSDRHPLIAWKSHLMRKYGITVEDYEFIYKEQEGKCKGCGRFFDKLSVDHDHNTNEIRGLLCRNCNMALGLLYDNKETLLNLLAYLEENNNG